MEQLLLWYSKNNSIVIQSLSIIIGFILCIFIFRLFFSSRQHEDIENSSLAKITETVENKMDQFFKSQGQKNMGLGESEHSEASPNLIEKLHFEILTLKQTIKDKDLNILSLQKTSEPTAANESLEKKVMNSSENTADSEATAVEVAGFKQEIENLKIRLSDYEVIAEDIADLHKLREENQKLTEQLKTFKNQSEDLINTSNVTEVSEQDKDLIEQFEKIKGT